jgi:predicted small metal-binding protein
VPSSSNELITNIIQHYKELHPIRNMEEHDQDLGMVSFKVDFGN